jgi:hypothetical protein
MARLTVPRSSETMSTTASVSSVKPSAARWRVPKKRLTSLDRESGRNTLAAARRPDWTTAAPSCSGLVGWKMDSSSSWLTRASSRSAGSTYSSRDAVRWMAISAPMRREASAKQARTTSSSIEVSGRGAKDLNSRPPARARP